MKKAILYADIHSGIGLGHKSRCQALQAKLTQHDFQTSLYDSQALLCHNTKAHVIVLDSYTLPLHAYQKALTLAKHCIFFDDTLRLAYPKGILLHSSLGGNLKTYQRIYPHHILWIGKDYTLLQEPFCKDQKSPQPKMPTTILLSVGAEDELKLMPLLIHTIQTHFPHLTIFCISKYPQSKRAHCFYGLDAHAMHALFLQVDIAISAAGQTLLELLACKIPTIALAIASNQQSNLHGTKDCTISIDKVWNLPKQALTQQLIHALGSLHNPITQQNLSTKAKHLFSQTKWKEAIKSLEKDDA